MKLTVNACGKSFHLRSLSTCMLVLVEFEHGNERRLGQAERIYLRVLDGSFRLQVLDPDSDVKDSLGLALSNVGLGYKRAPPVSWSLANYSNRVRRRD
jgi:hypothetical protein